MNLRDLINRLDQISEADLSDYDTQRALSNRGRLPQDAPDTSVGSNAEQNATVSDTMKSTSDRVRMNKIVQHMYTLLQQLRNTADLKESTYLSQELVESFGYKYQFLSESRLEKLFEQDEVPANPPPTKKSPSIIDKLFKTSGGEGFLKVFRNLGFTVFGYYELKDAGKQIIKIWNSDDPNKTEKIAKIITKLVAEYGLMKVGAAIGAMIIGASTGSMAMVATTVGAIIANWVWGNDVNKFIDEVFKWLSGEAIPGKPFTSKDDEPTQDQETPTEPAPQGGAPTPSDTPSTSIDLGTHEVPATPPTTPHGDTHAPKPMGGSPTPAPAVNPNLKRIIDNIMADVNQLQSIRNPDVEPDAQKAIQHAIDTIRIYAPNYTT